MGEKEHLVGKLVLETVDLISGIVAVSPSRKFVLYGMKNSSSRSTWHPKDVSPNSLM